MIKQTFTKAAAISVIIAASILGASLASAQTAVIRGRVVDSGWQAVIGAAVTVPGTTNGTMTDVDGNFEIRVIPGTTLEVSCIGYVTKRVAAAALQGKAAGVEGNQLLDHFCQAVKGKALMFKGDYAGAKTALGQVIQSGKYALVPSDRMETLYHYSGRGNEESVFSSMTPPSTDTTSAPSRTSSCSGAGASPHTRTWASRKRSTATSRFLSPRRTSIRTYATGMNDPFSPLIQGFETRLLVIGL